MPFYVIFLPEPLTPERRADRTLRVIPEEYETARAAYKALRDLRKSLQFEPWVVAVVDEAGKPVHPVFRIHDEFGNHAARRRASHRNIEELVWFYNAHTPDELIAYFREEAQGETPPEKYFKTEVEVTLAFYEPDLRPDLVAALKAAIGGP